MPRHLAARRRAQWGFPVLILILAAGALALVLGARPFAPGARPDRPQVQFARLASDQTPRPTPDRASDDAPIAESDLAGFQEAERALQAADWPAYARLAGRLAQDPLLPYLKAAELDVVPGPESDANVESLLAAFPGTAPTERVRADYIKRLAAAGRWADLARVWRDGDESAERRCLWLRALIETGRAGEALTAANLEPLWLAPRPQPAACEPVFAAWRSRGGLDTPMVWRRIRLALDAGETSFARQLGGRLPAAERPWLERWLVVRARPAQGLDTLEAAGPHPQATAILADGLVRLARTDARGAADRLTAARPRLAADPAALDAVLAAVGQGLSAAGDPAGLALWDGMSARADNLEAQERRLRAAIRRGDWARVAAWVERMPERTEKHDRWLYWLGRARAALGDTRGAAAADALAARARSLWAFLAADRAGLPYRLEPRPVPVAPERLARLAADPAMARVAALRSLGREGDMRREWRLLTRGLDTADLQAAAVLADRMGWHDQAIFTLARTDYWDDLDLRFPLGFRDLVEAEAAQSGLPTDWIYGVIRQESVFNPTVASGAGALGLMQLMPGTARQVAAGLGLAEPKSAAILDPALNIRLGARYLAELSGRFAHPALATAAYNAGPHRVMRWLPESSTPADLWIAAIPFDETRGYVERVLAYRIIYRARLGLPPERLSDLLPPVRPRADYQVALSTQSGN